MQTDTTKKKHDDIIRLVKPNRTFELLSHSHSHSHRAIRCACKQQQYFLFYLLRTPFPPF